MKTYQEFNESLTDWYNKGRNVRVPNEDQASFETLRKDDSDQQGKFIKKSSRHYLNLKTKNLKKRSLL